jgi:hypothetical protein
MAEYSNNVWIDHVDVSSDRDHDKDYYDGLIDVRASQPEMQQYTDNCSLPTPPTT